MISQLKTGLFVAVFASLLLAVTRPLDPEISARDLVYIVVGIWAGIAGQLVAQALVKGKK